MSGSLTDASENLVLNAIFQSGGSIYTGAYKIALVTAIGSDSAAGTEVTGGSYARQTVVWTSSSASVTSNTLDLTFAGMPACTVVGIDVFDSSGTPKRIAWMTLAASKTLGSGDTLVLPAGQVTIQLD